jgi:hypothetical protein
MVAILFLLCSIIIADRGGLGLDEIKHEIERAKQSVTTMYRKLREQSSIGQQDEYVDRKRREFRERAVCKALEYSQRACEQLDRRKVLEHYYYMYYCY